MVGRSQRKLNEFGEHSLSDAITIIRALEAGPPIPKDLAFPHHSDRRPSWPVAPKAGFADKFNWHQCRKLSFFPVRVRAGKVVAVSPLDDQQISWSRVAALLRRGGCAEITPGNVREKVVVRKFRRPVALEGLDGMIDIIDLIAGEGRHLLSGWACEANSVWSDFLKADKAKTRRADTLTRFAMRLGTTEACIEILRALNRCSADTDMFDRFVAGLFSLCSATMPPLVPLLSLRAYFSGVVAVPTEPAGLLPIVREEVRARCERAKTELQTITHSIEEQLSSLIDKDRCYCVYGFSRLILSALDAIARRKQFRVCIVDNSPSDIQADRKRSRGHFLDRHKGEWSYVTYRRFARAFRRVTGDQRPAAVIVGARCCFAQGALCERGLGDLVQFVRDHRQAWPEGPRNTELVLVAGRYKYYRGHMEAEILKNWARASAGLHEFVPLTRAWRLIL